MTFRTLAALALLGFTSSFLHAQNVNIPDTIFKAYLIGNTAINTNADSEIQVSEAIAYTDDIEIEDANIEDFTGIEAFSAVKEVYIDGNKQSVLNLAGMDALEKLWTNDCDSLEAINFGSHPDFFWLNAMDCKLSSIDVTTFPLLVYLHISLNDNITSIDVSNNPSLSALSLTGCDVSTLDLSNNMWLQELYVVWNTNLEELDLSNQPYLGFLNAGNCDLHYLNVANGNNAQMNDSEFRIYGNPNLFCVEVDDTTYSNNNWYNYVDPHNNFSDSCGPSPSAGLNDLGKNHIRVTNNPTTDFAYLSESCTYTVASLSGSILAEAKQSAIVDLRDLAPGTYILIVENEKNTPPATYKLVKQ